VLVGLASTPVSQDELERARTPVVETFQKMRQSNEFWLSSLQLTQREPRARDAIIGGPKAVANVTAQDVQALFKRFVIGKTPITVISQAR
jgi:zinc protease